MGFIKPIELSENTARKSNIAAFVNTVYEKGSYSADVTILAFWNPIRDGYTGMA